MRLGCQNFKRPPTVLGNAVPSVWHAGIAQRFLCRNLMERISNRVGTGRDAMYSGCVTADEAGAMRTVPQSIPC